MNYICHLTQHEVDNLTETFDHYITSKTSSALSTLLCEPIENGIKVMANGVSNYKVLSIPPDEILMCGVRLTGKGDTHIEILYTIKMKHAKKIAAKLLCEDNVAELDEMGSSAIQEVANIMTGSFFNAMASGTGFRVDISTPNYSHGDLGSLVDLSARDVIKQIELAVVADAQLVGQQSGIKIHMIIIQDPDNARKLLANISKQSKTCGSVYPRKANPKHKEPPENKMDSGKYRIGMENQELDELINQALNEEEKKVESETDSDNQQ